MSDSETFLAWTESDDKRTLYLEISCDGRILSQKIKITTGAYSAPALAIFQNKLYIAWVGSEKTVMYRNFYYESVEGTYAPILGPVTEIPSFYTTLAPAMTVYDDKLYIAWIDAIDRTINFRYSIDGVHFIDGPPNLWADNTNTSPALASAQGRLFVGWKAGSNSSVKVMASSNGMNFTETLATSGIETGWAPALASSGDDLFLLWSGPKGSSPNNDINFNYGLKGESFSQWSGISASTQTAPAATFDNGVLEISYADPKSNVQYVLAVIYYLAQKGSKKSSYRLIAEPAAKSGGQKAAQCSSQGAGEDWVVSTVNGKSKYAPALCYGTLSY